MKRAKGLSLSVFVRYNRHKAQKMRNGNEAFDENEDMLYFFEPIGCVHHGSGFVGHVSGGST